MTEEGTGVVFVHVIGTSRNDTVPLPRHPFSGTKDQRHGRLFKLPTVSTGRPMRPEKVGAIVSEIREKAGVVVNKAEGKFASAHDLRRAFGTRWATKVKPPVLQHLMRHRNIETTLKYYVALDADDIADELWAKHAPVGTSVGTLPNPPSRETDGDMPADEKTPCEARGSEAEGTGLEPATGKAGI
jgi:integrase